MKYYTCILQTEDQKSDSAADGGGWGGVTK